MVRVDDNDAGVNTAHEHGDTANTCCTDGACHHDICIDGWAQTSMTVDITDPTKTFSWWVHALNSSGYSAQSDGPAFYCQNAEAPLCTAWDDLHINSCTYSDWNTSPRSNTCVTGNTAATLTTTSTGTTPTQMRFRELTDPNGICLYDPDTGWSAWEAYSTTKAWTLLAGNGEKKVCAQYQNDYGSSPKCGALIQISNKTCSVLVSPAINDYLEDFTISYSGTGNPNYIEDVRLMVADESGAGETEISSCSSVYGAGCEVTVVQSFPVGNYKVWCDLWADPRKCSGSPFCDYEGGSDSCTAAGWVSCSASDNSSFISDPACRDVNFSPHDYWLTIGQEQQMGVTSVTTPDSAEDGWEADASSVDYTISGPPYYASLVNGAGNNVTLITGTTPGTNVNTRGVLSGVTTITAAINLLDRVQANPACYGTTTVTVTDAVAWYQTEGGDVYAEGGISSTIPNTCTSGCDPNFSLPLLAGQSPGVVMYKTNFDFGAGFPSSDTENNWLVHYGGLRQQYGYNSFAQTVVSPQPAGTPGQEWTPEVSPDLTALDGSYTHQGNVVLPNSGTWTVASGRKIVILVDGNVTINADIIVPDDAFLGIIATGDIQIEATVANVQGVYVTDQVINIDQSNIKFIGKGVFVGLDSEGTGQGINLARDFAYDPATSLYYNFDNPAETFIYDPSYWFNSTALWSISKNWQEVAP